MSRLPAAVEWIPARVRGRAGHRLMVVLAAPGCAWARSSGGCTNCGFAQNLAAIGPVSAGDLEAQLSEALARIPTGQSPVEVDLFCSGSYFNDAEVPAPAQEALLHMAARRPEVESLLVETRPEYATDARLARAVQASGGIPLEVAIGLESASPAILQRIHKGFTWEDFVIAAQRVAKAGAGLVSYVLLKPIDTEEDEALQDSVDTAARVFSLGMALDCPTRIALEPCFIPPRTALFTAFQEGRYRPPWLWTVLEAVRRVAPLGPLQVGLSDEGMNPLQVPHNCDACTPRVRQALAEFNRSQDLLFLRGLDSQCRTLWKQEVRKSPGAGPG